MRLVLGTRVPSADRAVLARINVATRESAELALSDLSVVARVEPVLALAILLCVEADRPNTVFYRVYHTCERHAVDERAMREGMPKPGFQCPECERRVTRSSMSFDVVCRMRTWRERLTVVRGRGL